MDTCVREKRICSNVLAECDLCVSAVVLCCTRKLISHSSSDNPREKRRKRPAQDITEQILC